MKIVILRHGKPDLPATGRLNACELHKWLRSYDAAGINQNQIPPAKAIEIAASCKVVVCSDLPRSIQSADALSIKQVHLSEPVLREISIPCPCWDSPRLSLMLWAALLRTLWFLGYSANGESFRSSKQRARSGAEMLEKTAVEHGSVLFVGHGLINHFIAKELLSNGWQGPKSPGKQHWEFGFINTRRNSGRRGIRP